ncbi:hypothetical protein AURDEDRAFT_160223 [Auricularia subglabra TFB-10046 SS5]|nr:hypothetical protein AURDEDRAFT_160223 [Auricularia subglabra TFB-10046 SS5]
MPLRELPDELLRVVFSAVVAEMRSEFSWDDWDRHMSAEVPFQPFDLAAVCHRWREIALDMSALWSVISFRLYDPDSIPSTLDCVMLMLERSGAAPLDIILGWQDFYWPHITPEVGLLYSALQMSASRWRRFFLVVPDDLKDPDDTDRGFFDMFRQPTPLLEEFSIVSTNWEKNIYSDNFPQYLPYCPQLRKLRTEMCNIFPTATQPHPGVPHLLEQLSMCCILPERVLRQLLNLTTELVRLELLLMTKPENPGINAGAPLCLSRLEHMTLSGDSVDYINMWMDRLRLPHLASLQLDGARDAAVEQLLPRLRDTVVTLRIVSDEMPLSPDDARPLAALTRLRRLELDALLEWRFLSALTAPALETLVLGELQQFDEEEEEAENLAHAVLDFARAHRGRVRIEFADEPIDDCDLLIRMRRALDRLQLARA